MPVKQRTDLPFDDGHTLEEAFFGQLSILDEALNRLQLRVEFMNHKLKQVDVAAKVWLHQ
jgi:hypothetical protein